jgi:twitching motility protein PilI
MAARVSLSEFQAQLARKLAESAQRPVASDWLGISLRGVRALLPLAHAGEIFDPAVLQPLPHTQPWVMGVTSLRGGLQVVIDWVSLLHLSPQAEQAAGDVESVYWVSFNPSLGVGAALCADHLLGLRAASGLTRAEDISTHATVRQAWRDAEGAIWYELDLALLAQSPEFLDPRLPAFAAAGTS